MKFVKVGMFIGQCIGSEKIDSEYKEFCLKDLPYDYFTKDEVVKIISGQWNPKLNDIIHDNINIYIELYLTKCISAFTNSNIDGNLLIGCNDFGEMTAIPYYVKTESDFKEIKDKIQQKIYKECRDNLSEKVPIEISIDKLKVNKLLIDDELRPLLETYEHKIQEYQNLNQKFIKRKEAWMNKILKYSAKLKILLNTHGIRKELIQFILNNDGDKNVITNLLNSEYIKAPSGEDMKEARDSQNPTTLAYWLANFKDTKLDDIMKMRPKRPRKQIPPSPFMVLHRLSLFRYRFSKLKNVEFITIKISVKSKNISNIVKYKDRKINEWVSNVRLFKKGEPCQERIYTE